MIVSNIMADPNALPHPRKLYTNLREASSSQARAQASLDFLRTCTSSDAGFLFVLRGGELALAASTDGAQPPAALVTEARRTWDRELDRQPDDNKTLELSSIEALRQTQESPLWKSPEQEVYERRLLSVYRNTGWTPVGLVMLRAKEGRALVPIRQAHIEAMCNALLDSGDVQDRPAAQQSPQV